MTVYRVVNFLFTGYVFKIKAVENVTAFEAFFRINFIPINLDMAILDD